MQDEAGYEFGRSVLDDRLYFKGINNFRGLPNNRPILIPRRILMKKFSVFLAILSLVLSSLACQAIMGGGGSPVPGLPDSPDVPDITVPDPTNVPDDGDNDFNVGGDSQFPITGDAFNVITTADTVTYQTNMNADDVSQFYRDEFAAQGYEEDDSMAVTFGGNFTLGFTDGNGKAIIVAGVDAGDGSLYVTVTSQ